MARHSPQLKPHAWRPGQSGNPGGRPSIPPELRAINAMTADEVGRLIAKYFRMSLEEGKRALATPGLAMGDIWILKCLEKGMKSGDPSKLSALLDRAIGRVLDAAALDRPPMTNEELVAMLGERFPHIVKGAS